MEVTAPASDASAPQTPSFSDILRNAVPVGQEPAPEPTPAPAASAPTPEPAAAATTAPAPAAATTAESATFDEAQWVKQQFGEAYKTPAEIQAALQERETLRASQPTDAQRAVLQLASDPAQLAEFAQLMSTDYATLDNEQVLFRQFKQDNPTLSAESLQRKFDKYMAGQFPGLENEAGDPDHKADTEELQAHADKLRQQFTSAKEQRLQQLRDGALTATGPTPEQVQQQADDHLAAVAQALKPGADGLGMQLDVDGTALNLAVAADDLPRIQQYMTNPLDGLTKEDGSVDYEQLKQFALWRAMGPKWLAVAQQAGREAKGPQVAVEELANASGGAPSNPDAQPSFSQLLQAAGHQGGSRKPQY